MDGDVAFSILNPRFIPDWLWEIYALGYKQTNNKNNFFFVKIYYLFYNKI